MNPLLTLPTVAGLEHELATIAFDSSGQRIDSRVEHDALIDSARRRHPHLHGRRGIYLGNSLNLYEDASNGGAHLEIATPECSSPAELAAQSEAGNRIVQELVEASVFAGGGVRRAHLYRHSADYLAQVSWASHLSVLSTQPVREMRADIAAHLVSKVVYAGSGGFLPGAPEIAFCLAPRVATFTCVDSGAQTERDRGLIGGDKENHCPGGLVRAHFLCHENLCSPLARYLDVGGTMLVVRLINAGVMPRITLSTPMRAVRTFATDPFCGAKVAVEGRGRMTAVEIQRHYLACAEQHLGAPFMPPWAADFCGIWRHTLDLIAAEAPWSVSDRLDWAAKHVLLSRHADTHHNGSWTACPDALMEIDMRYGQAGTGIFDQLRASGIMDGDVPGVGAEDIERAKQEAPQETRARFRGEWIKKLYEAGTAGYASWTWIEDEANNMLLDLHDPWGRNAEWRRSESPPGILDDFPFSVPRLRPLRPRGRELLNSACGLHDRGEFAEAYEILQRVLGMLGTLDESEVRRCLEYHAGAAAQLGLNSAVESLALLEANAGARTQHVVGHRLYVMRLMELLPVSDELKHWIAEADELSFGSETNRDPVLLTDLAACLNRLGRASSAEACLTEALACCHLENGRHHLRARAEMGETQRLLGRPGRAMELLEDVARRQLDHMADLNGATLMYLAKRRGGLDGRQLLAGAIEFQRTALTPVAEVRSLLLDARMQGPTREESQLRRIRELQRTVQVLHRDPTLDKMLLHWSAWVGGADDPAGSGDRYWRL